jgi:hypothetical protein
LENLPSDGISSGARVWPLRPRGNVNVNKRNWMPTQNAGEGPSSEKRKRKIEPININTLEVMAPNPFLLEALKPANSCTQREGNLPLPAWNAILTAIRASS